MRSFSKVYKEVLKKFEVERYLKQAKNLMDNKLSFIHIWDMERDENVYDIPKDWNEYVSEDEEWIFMRARMNYFEPLFLAYEKYNEEKYLYKIKEIIFDFIISHKVLKYELSTRTLDSGIRIINILRAFMYLKELGFLSNDEQKNIIDHLDNTCKYIFLSYKKRYDQSNWGLIQMAAVYSFSLLFNGKQVEKAKKYLDLEIETQILKDGLNWEKSITYHIQIMLYLIFVIMIEKDLSIINEKYQSYLEKMTEALKKLHYPDNKGINFGDSDYDDISPIISLSETVLGKSTSYDLGTESYMFAPNYVEKYLKCEKKIKREVNIFNESGYFHIRDEKFSLSAYNAKLSTGHSHIDYLHFNYFYKKPIFIDTGRYTYLENEKRKYLKSINAHNSIIVDNKMDEIKDSWTYNYYPIILPTRVESTDDYTYIEMNVFDIKTNSLLTRKLISIEENVIIVNTVRNKGKHFVTLKYHISNFTKYKKEKDKVIFNDEIIFYISNYEIQEGIYSSKYNEVEKINVITSKREFIDEYNEINTILLKENKLEKIDIFQEGEKTKKNNIFGLKLITKNKTYKIFIKNTENTTKSNFFHLEDIPLTDDFKVVVFEN